MRQSEASSWKAAMEHFALLLLSAAEKYRCTICAHISELKQSYQGEKWFISWFLFVFFPALITAFYCLASSSSTLPCDVDSSTAAL